MWMWIVWCNEWDMLTKSFYGFHNSCLYAVNILTVFSANVTGIGIRFRVMVFNATFNNISVILWRPVLLVEKIGVLGENHRPTASHCQTLSHNVVSSCLAICGFELTIVVVIGIDWSVSCKSNYHTITTTTAPYFA
jgi:hypothetical protein